MARKHYYNSCPGMRRLFSFEQREHKHWCAEHGARLVDTGWTVNAGVALVCPAAIAHSMISRPTARVRCVEDQWIKLWAPRWPPTKMLIDGVWRLAIRAKKARHCPRLAFDLVFEYDASTKTWMGVRAEFWRGRGSLHEDPPII